MYYAIYDRKTGHVLHTHTEVDASGKPKKLSESQVLAMLDSSVDRSSVGVASLEKKPEKGKPFRIDPKTSKVKQD